MKLRFWYSVYAATEDVPSPSAMPKSLRPPIQGLIHELEPDGEQWRSGRFRLSTSAHPAILVRRERRGDEELLRKLEDAESCLREMLNEPHRDLVLSQIARTQQVIYLTPCPGIELGPSKLARMCEQLCGFLARTSDGLIQVYQEGFFNSQGESLLPYNPRHRLKTI